MKLWNEAWQLAVSKLKILLLKMFFSPICVDIFYVGTFEEKNWKSKRSTPQSGTVFAAPLKVTISCSIGADSATSSEVAGSSKMPSILGGFFWSQHISLSLGASFSSVIFFAYLWSLWEFFPAKNQPEKWGDSSGHMAKMITMRSRDTCHVQVNHPKLLDQKQASKTFLTLLWINEFQ